MQTHEILQLVWNKLNCTNSTCPDVELGKVRRVLGEAMATYIRNLNILNNDAYVWVLGQILIDPRGEEWLAEEWYEINHSYVSAPKPPNGNYEAEGYLQAIEAHFATEDRERAQKAIEITEAIKKLTEMDLIGIRQEGGCAKYFADPRFIGTTQESGIIRPVQGWGVAEE
jgi:hypothetical protein